MFDTQQVISFPGLMGLSETVVVQPVHNIRAEAG